MVPALRLVLLSLGLLRLKSCIIFFTKKTSISQLRLSPFTDIFGIILHLPTPSDYFVRQLLLLYGSDFI